jgi:fibronectin type 3 domain-containing protein
VANTPVPFAPLTLNALADGTPKVALDWTASSGAQGYNVKRSTTKGGPYTTIANVTMTNYTDSIVALGMTYYYVVSGTNAFGESGYNSMEISTTASDLAGWWKFDETNGTTAADSSVGGHNGTLQSSASWGAGTISNAVQLDGTSSGYVDMGDGVVSTLNDFTISTWVKVNTNANWARLFDFGSGTSYYMFLTPQSGSSTIRYAIKNNGGEQQINGPSALSAGVWHHVAVTLSGTTGKMYVDGVAVGTNSSMTIKPSDLGNTWGNYIGKSQFNDPYLNGSVDDFRIYNRALSATEISTLRNKTLPATPTGLTATPGNAQVALTWNTASGATRYNVKRATVSGGSYAMITNVTSTSFTDSGLTSGTYYYVVSALNVVAESADSVPASATPTAAPAAPSGLTASVGDAQVGLSWNPVVGATGYIVRRATVSGGPYTSITTNSLPACTDPGLVNGTTYYYVVASQNAAGVSGDSTPVSLKPVALPATPTNLSVTASAGQSGLSWSTVSNATLYKVKRSLTSGGPYTTLTSISSTNMADVGLVNGLAYYYVVSAVNGNGESANSAQVSVTPTDVPALVHRYSFSETSGATVADSVGGAAWNGALPNGGTFSGGKLTLASGSSQYMQLPAGILSNYTAVTIETWVTFPTQLPNACFFFGFGNVISNSGYNYIFCQPKNGRAAITDGSYSSEQNANTGVDFSFRSNFHLAFVFNPPGGTLAIYTNGVLAGINTGITIPMSSVNDVYNWIGRSLYSGDSYVGCTLDEFRIYNGALSEYQIAAAQALGANQLLPTDAPAVPTGLVATGTNMQVTLGWNAVSGATNYSLKWSLTNGSGYVTLTNLAGTSFVHTGLTNGTTYYYVVSALNAAGESAVSASASATPLSPVPSAPIGLTTVPGDSWVALSWNASGGATGYNVKSSLTNGGAYAVIGTNVGCLAFTNTGLLNGTNYYYVVSAVNAGGESANSAQVFARPVSPVPTSLNFTTSGGQFQFTWSADHTGWRLQVQTNMNASGLGTNWVTVSDSTNLNQIFVPIVATNGSVFYRLAYP